MTLDLCGSPSQMKSGNSWSMIALFLRVSCSFSECPINNNVRTYMHFVSFEDDDSWEKLYQELLKFKKKHGKQKSPFIS